jgi:hypothetical protein
MIDQHTSPAIRLSIIQNLHQWKQQLPPKTNSLSTTLATALSTQTAIGWNNFIKGQMSDCWAPLQQQFYMSLGKKTTGRSWAVSLLVQLWQLSWNQWDNCNHIDKNTVHPEKEARLEILNDRIRAEYESDRQICSTTTGNSSNTLYRPHFRKRMRHKNSNGSSQCITAED